MSERDGGKRTDKRTDSSGSPASNLKATNPKRPNPLRSVYPPVPALLMSKNLPSHPPHRPSPFQPRRWPDADSDREKEHRPPSSNHHRLGDDLFLIVHLHQLAASPVPPARLPRPPLILDRLPDLVALLGTSLVPSRPLSERMITSPHLCDLTPHLTEALGACSKPYKGPPWSPEGYPE